MRIVITGASGFLAGHVLRQASEALIVEGWSRNPRNKTHAEWRDIDLLDFAALDNALDDSRPDALINAAAIPNIDYCEQNREEADRINAEIPRVLAEKCAMRNIRFVQVSTDNVFEGTRSFYKEDDDRRPVNHYGWTKAAAEDAVLAVNPKSAVVRLPLIVGWPAQTGGNSFLALMMPKWKAGETVGVPGNEIRTPVDVATAAEALLELAKLDFAGRIHIAGTERINRLDFVRNLAVALGFRTEQVEENDPTKIPGRAARPLDVSLDTALARQTLKTPLLDASASIDRVVEQARQAGFV
jgi:dTDP-4-dehydrorhamnose reductase